jgi:hypothetical protein
VKEAMSIIQRGQGREMFGSNALDEDDGQDVSSLTPVESVVDKDTVPCCKDDKHGN